MRVNKKAQSEIITTVLIILLVLAAVVIVWQVVSRTMSDTRTDINKQNQCLGVLLSVTKATSDETTTPYTGAVTIQRETGNSDTLQVKGQVYVSADNGQTWALNTTTTKSLKEFDSDLVSINGLAVGHMVKVTPMLEDGTLCSGESSPKTVIAA